MAILEERIDFVSLLLRKKRHAAQTGQIYLVVHDLRLKQAPEKGEVENGPAIPVRQVFEPWCILIQPPFTCAFFTIIHGSISCRVPGLEFKLKLKAGVVSILSLGADRGANMVGWLCLSCDDYPPSAMLHRDASHGFTAAVEGTLSSIPGK